MTGVAGRPGEHPLAPADLMHGCPFTHGELWVSGLSRLPGRGRGTCCPLNHRACGYVCASLCPDDLSCFYGNLIFRAREEPLPEGQEPADGPAGSCAGALNARAPDRGAPFLGGPLGEPSAKLQRAPPCFDSEYLLDFGFIVRYSLGDGYCTMLLHVCFCTFIQVRKPRPPPMDQNTENQSKRDCRGRGRGRSRPAPTSLRAETARGRPQRKPRAGTRAPPGARARRAGPGPAGGRSPRCAAARRCWPRWRWAGTCGSCARRAPPTSRRPGTTGASARASSRGRRGPAPGPPPPRARRTPARPGAPRCPLRTRAPPPRRAVGPGRRGPERRVTAGACPRETLLRPHVGGAAVAMRPRPDG